MMKIFIEKHIERASNKIPISEKSFQKAKLIIMECKALEANKLDNWVVEDFLTKTRHRFEFTLVSRTFIAGYIEIEKIT